MNSKSIRRILAATLAAALCMPAAASAVSVQDVTAQSIPSFTITGTGCGHGIGMSQYGAYGAAKAGKTYDWILEHYFQDTSISTKSIDWIYVNVDCAYRPGRTYAGRSSFTVKSVGSALKVWLTSTKDGLITLSADTFYTFTRSGGSIVVKTTGGTQVGRLAGTVWLGPAGGSNLLEFKDKTTSTDGAYHAPAADGTPTNGWVDVRYRGQVWLDLVGTSRLSAVNRLSMEQYLYGVVPREMPSSWGNSDIGYEALKAQAVAARSYAYPASTKGTSGVLACTTYSQVYKGHSRVSGGDVLMHEATSTNIAVDATNSKLVMYGTTTVVQTFFFSQDGGHTANIEDVWTGADPKPYYTGVSDPYEALASPGYCPWPSSKQVTLTGLTLAAKLASLDGVPVGAVTSVYVTGVTVERADSGYARYVTFKFSNGASAKITGDSVRSKLGLLSTAFYFSGFPVSRIYGTDRYATAVKVSEQAFADTAPVVVLASGKDYADALSGAGLAGAKKGALLLTDPDSLSAVVKARLEVLKPTTVYLLGGLKVSKAVTDALPGVEILSLTGDDRYETALLAAKAAYPSSAPAGVMLVSGTSWADGVSASALAYAKGYPVLLTPGDVLGDDAKSFLSTMKPATTIMVGGTAVLKDAVATQAGTATGKVPVRRWGSDRYRTAASVAEYGISNATFTLSDIYLATGMSYADALAGGTLAGKLGKPLLLTGTNSVPDGTSAFLAAHRTVISELHLFGGTVAISEAGATALDSVMMK